MTNTSHIPIKSKWLLSCVLLLLVTVAGISKEQEEEFFVKAIFIKKFTNFIQWPESSDIADTSKPFIIKVIGKNPFGNFLNIVYSQQTIKNKKVHIEYITTIAEIPGCHILFISSSWANRLQLILAVTRNNPILTIGDTQGFANLGVMINFIYVDKKLRFEINESAFKEGMLLPTSMLLRAALIIIKAPPQQEHEKR